MTNIGFLIPSLHKGGTERVVSTLSQHFSDRINVFIILHDAQNVMYDYEGELIDLNLNTKWYIHNSIGLLKGSYKLKEIKNDNNIDIIISFLTHSNQINLISSFLENRCAKTIISVRSYQSRRSKFFFRSSIEYIFKYKLYDKSDSIVAISKGVKYDLKKNFGITNKNIETIYNPCDVEKIKKLAKSNISYDKLRHVFKFNNIIISVGNLKIAKGQWHLLRAFRKVNDEFPNTNLVLIGEDRGLINYFKVLVKKLGLENNIFFLGFQENPFKYLAKSDIFVLSSLFEGFGNVIIEAMACGLPIISTDCRAGPREILAPDTDFRKEIKDDIEYAKYGVLTPVCDGKKYGADDPLTKEEELLAEAIMNLLEKKGIRKKYSKRSKERAQDFHPELIVKQWMEII